jgi:hypothetical protein
MAVNMITGVGSAILIAFRKAGTSTEKIYFVDVPATDAFFGNVIP